MFWSEFDFKADFGHILRDTKYIILLNVQN
jgi:hypothetical protein